LQASNHNVHQARALKVLVAVRVAKKVGVSVTIAARLQVVVTLAVSRAPMPRAVTNRLPTVASARLPHVVTSPSPLAVTSLLLRVAISRLQIAAKNLSLLVVTGLLPRVVKNHTHLVVTNRLVIVAMPHAVINLTPHAAKILTRMRALSHVRLSPTPTAVLQTARRTQANPLAQHVTLRLVPQHQVAKRLRHAVMAQRVRVLRVQARHVPLPVHVAALPLTAVAVKL
jgi:hypothetical protein